MPDHLAGQQGANRPAWELFRLVRSADFPLEDFLSDEAKGLPMRSEQERDIRTYRGISMFVLREAAQERARRWPHLGGFVVRLEIPDVPFVEVHKTLSGYHYSVIGLPRILRSYVVDVEPVG